MYPRSGPCYRGKVNAADVEWRENKLVSSYFLGEKNGEFIDSHILLLKFKPSSNDKNDL
jgi:hypothetical protein